MVEKMDSGENVLLCELCLKLINSVQTSKLTLDKNNQDPNIGYQDSLYHLHCHLQFSCVVL